MVSISPQNRAIPVQNSSQRAVVLIQSIGLILICLFAALYSGFDIQAESLIMPVCWLIVVLSAWSFWSWHRITGTWFDPYTMFLAAVILFNGGLAFLAVLRLLDSDILGGLFSAKTLLTALLAVAGGIAALHWGALVSALRRIRQVASPRQIHSLSSDTTTLNIIGWALLGISIVPIVSNLYQALSVVTREGYFALYQQEAGIGIQSGAQILAGFFVTAVIFLFASHPHSKGYVFLTAFLIAAQFLILMIVGARYNAVAPLLAYAWVWHRCRKPLSAVVILVSAIGMLALFSFVKDTRNTAIVDRTFDYVAANPDESIQNPIASSVAEMGGSLQTVAYTIDLVPSYRPYDYGVQYAYSLFTVFPNFFWAVHPSIAHGTPAAWLVQTVAPDVAAAGGGMGYSLIAESYLNFGYWGVPVVLLLLGYFYVRFVTWGAWSDDPAKIAVVAVFLSFFLIYARADSTIVIRPLIWFVLLPYGLVLILRKRVPGEL